MKKLCIDVSKPYDVIIKNGLLNHIDDYIDKNKKILIVTDSNVFSIYEKKLASCFEKISKEYYIYVINAGEKSKSIENFAKILEFAAARKFSRSDIFVSFGGGVCGDLCGFCAACYLRGVEYIQIPTTLLSMVDSSVGGKTAVDLEAGKNLAGCFYQPSLVLCDPELLKTLDDKTFREGMAEVIKYAFLKESNLYSLINNKDLNFEEVIYTCVDIKREFVAADEFDKGLRQMLNFGHTFAHVFEKLSDFEISHGFAVAMGMNMITIIAAKCDFCNKDTLAKLQELLKVHNLPLFPDNTGYKFTVNQIIDVMLNDKKCFNQKISFIIPDQTGICKIMPVEISNLHNFIANNLETVI